MTTDPDQIRMLRDYDAGVGLTEGRVHDVGYGSGAIDPGKARALCRPAADGDGPYAQPVVPHPSEGDDAND
jgi:hypothetical protein